MHITTGVGICTYIRIHITRFKKMLCESEELVINRSSRLKDNIVHARIQTTTHIIIIKSSLITRDIHNTYYYIIYMRCSRHGVYVLYCEYKIVRTGASPLTYNIHI